MLASVTNLGNLLCRLRTSFIQQSKYKMNLQQWQCLHQTVLN